MNKYKHKIPKDDLKRFAKDVAKKLVSSDYKAGRVDDPTKISEKQQKKVKSYCKEYFDKAASKHKKMEEDRSSRKEKSHKVESSRATPTQSPKPPALSPTPKKEEQEDEDVKMSDIEDNEPLSPSESLKNGTLKRKRSQEPDVHMKSEFDDDDLTKSPAKRLNLEVSIPAPPPPPPPAPPADSPTDHNSPDTAYENGQTANMEPDVHADSNFKGRSMADVQALAQMEADDEVDWDEDDVENTVKVENPLVQEQPV